MNRKAKYGPVMNGSADGRLRRFEICCVGRPGKLSSSWRSGGRS